MLKSDLVQTDKHSIIILLRRKKSPIFTSHKSYKNSLAKSGFEIPKINLTLNLK